MGDTDEKQPDDDKNESDEIERPDDAPEGLSLAVNRDGSDCDKEVAELEDQ